MCVDHRAVFFVGQTNCRQTTGVGVAARHETERRQLGKERRVGDVEARAGIDLGPQLAHLGTVTTDQIEHEALEVRGLGNIHRRARRRVRLGRAARAIDTSAEELVEHVVLVGGEDQLGHRQAHHACDVASADVAEVAGRHTEGELLIVGFSSGEVALEVIDDLRGDATPVDRIDGTDLVLGLEGVIIGDGLNDVLRIIEHAVHGDVEDVVVLQRVHLRALEGRHAAVWREHEDAHALLAAHGVFGRRTGVAGGGAKDVDFFAAFLQHVLEQIAEQLHGHVLEGQRRAVR